MFLEKKGLKKLLLLQTLIGGGSPAVERIALGNPLTFLTDVAKPLKSLLIPFTPQQEGTGDPSPSNIRSILPWNGLKVFGGGKNLFNISDLIGKTGITVSGNEITGRMYRLLNLGTVDLVDSIPQGTTFKVAFKAYTDGSYTTSGVGLNIQIVDTNGNLTTVVRINNNVLEETYFNVSITAEAEIVGIKFGYNSGNENIWNIKGLVIGEADVYPVSFPSPVYGGTLDVVSGVLTVEWGIYEPTGTEGVYIEASNNRIAFVIPNEYRTQDTTDVYCTHFKAQTAGAYCYITTSMTVDELKAFFASNSVEIACKLATPQTVTLTPAQLIALVGDNTIWSDADGSMTCVYLVSSKYADEHPVGGLGFGFGSGSSDPDEPDDPENPDESEEPIIDDSENNQTEGEEP